MSIIYTYPSKSIPVGNDLLLISDVSTDEKLTKSVTANNIANLATEVTLTSLTLTATFPATSSSTGTTGMIATDANYIYVCTATNTWKRAAITTW
tara:strand:- start:1664 stop:1948 length:285 start_codon:yes stop_codon:yes gene_type:complete